jgi:pantoate kinase
MAYDAVAFCPGHITGVFEVCPDEDPHKMGSRGVGVCVSLGVHTGVVATKSSDMSVYVTINGESSEALVTRRAVENLPIKKDVHIELSIDAQLPVSQGFGMSGAGALSSAMAVNEALGLGLSRDDVVRAAHKAEVESMTGLGDVLPQSIGGLVVRTEPGAAPHGEVQKFEREGGMVLCVVGPPLYTKDVLSDEKTVARISKVGRQYVNSFLNETSMDNFLHLSLEFAREAELIPQAVEDAVEKCKEFGMASMSMLGNSVFAIGEEENLRYRLLDFGEAFICSIDNEGARIV